MRRSSRVHIPTVVDHAWRMGGRICDLSTDQIDGVVVALKTMRRDGLPVEVDRAQADMDMYAERYQTDREQVASC